MRSSVANELMYQLTTGLTYAACDSSVTHQHVEWPE